MKVLFVCDTGLFRSPVAEVIARELDLDEKHAYACAAVSPAEGPDPRALDTIRERGIFLTDHPKAAPLADAGDADVLVSLCDEARSAVEALNTNSRRVHWEIADPLDQRGSVQEIRTIDAVARDALEREISRLLDEL